LYSEIKHYFILLGNLKNSRLLFRYIVEFKCKLVAKPGSRLHTSRNDCNAGFMHLLDHARTHVQPRAHMASRAEACARHVCTWSKKVWP